MTTTTADEALDRLRIKARENPHLAEALELLAEGNEDGDPFAEVDEGVMVGVRTINRRRQTHRRSDLAQRALTTSQVVTLIDSISDRKAVDRRRRRGRLLGVKEGRTVLHPTWQFDPDRREARDDLDRVLAALGEVTSDPRAADAAMTTPRSDLDGRSLADLFAGGDTDLPVRLIRMAGDQS
ncbi:MAG: hypothetical protein M3Y91_07005 [Actinomycetota bacterium]|nr:hypothetical protein [Actinomycetota bacterium]